MPRASSTRDLEAVAAAFASGVGEHLLERLVQSLAEMLNVEYVLIGRLTGKHKDQVRTLAFCERGCITPSRTYALDGTPCANVISARGMCSFPSDVYRQFPRDAMLVDMKAQAYVGSPLKDSLGRVQGLLSIIAATRIKNDARARTLVQLFANRASLEVERMVIDQQQLKRAMGSP